MARRTVRTEIPSRSPDDLAKLAAAIALKHEQLAAASPLDAAEVTKMKADAEEASDKRAEAADLAARASLLNQQAATLLGIAPGQTARDVGTVLYHVTGFRNDLLGEHRGEEEALGGYGFQVVVGTARTPGARKSASSTAGSSGS